MKASQFWNACIELTRQSTLYSKVVYLKPWHFWIRCYHVLDPTNSKASWFLGKLPYNINSPINPCHVYIRTNLHSKVILQPFEINQHEDQQQIACVLTPKGQMSMWSPTKTSNHTIVNVIFTWLGWYFKCMFKNTFRTWHTFPNGIPTHSQKDTVANMNCSYLLFFINFFFKTFKRNFFNIRYLSSQEDLIHSILMCELTSMENFISQAIWASLYKNYIWNLFLNPIFIILNIKKVN